MREFFRELTDPRQAGKVKHNLLEIIVMTICAVIAGCDVWEDIADYCRAKETWFRESLHMKLENGIPSHDTMQRVWGMPEPKEFERCFCAWVEAVKRQRWLIRLVELPDGQVQMAYIILSRVIFFGLVL